MAAPQILIAEDEEQLRGLIAEMLTERHVDVVEAADGVEAYELLQSHPGVSLLLSDVKMPRMNGYDLVEQALALHPELKILMMTGYAQDPPAGLMRAREFQTLHKPFDLDRLCNLVRDMVG